MIGPVFPFAIVLVATSILAFPAHAAVMPAGGSSDEPLTDQLIIRLERYDSGARDGIADARLDALNRAAGTQLQRVRTMSGNARVIRLPRAVTLSEARAISARLAQVTGVVYAEPDAIMRIAATTPNDTRYNEQWHYFEPTAGINLPAAWDVTTGNAGITAAVLDTGILPHEDLIGRYSGGYDFVSNAIFANDGDGRDPDPTDPGDWCFGQPSSWHGTHVAGTIGAASNNAQGVSGINWVSTIQPVRVLGRCGGSTSDIADAIRWAAGLTVPLVPDNPNPAQVINMSLGGSGPCGTTFQTAIDDAVSAGTAVVVAAGNSTADASGFSPGNCNGVITVASVGRDGDLAYYSNFGSVVEVSAPGGETVSSVGNGVLSTLNAGTRTAGTDTYEFYQGTSMAAPHVTGVVSLLLSHNPSLTPAELSIILQDSAKAFPAGSDCATQAGLCGAGIVDAFAALNAGPGTQDPDLTVSSIVPSTRLLRPGTTAGLSVVVANPGLGAYAGDLTLRVQLSTDTIPDAGDVLINDIVQTVNLPAGGTQTINPNFVVPTVPRGRYYLIVTADPDNVITESDESNNAGVSLPVFVFGG